MLAIDLAAPVCGLISQQILSIMYLTNSLLAIVIIESEDSISRDHCLMISNRTKSNTNKY